MYTQRATRPDPNNYRYWCHCPRQQFLVSTPLATHNAARNWRQLYIYITRWCTGCWITAPSWRLAGRKWRARARTFDRKVVRSLPDATRWRFHRCFDTVTAFLIRRRTRLSWQRGDMLVDTRVGIEGELASGRYGDWFVPLWVISDTF